MKKRRLIKLLVLSGLTLVGKMLCAQHIVNPIPELIQRSDLILNLQTFATIPKGAGYADARVNMIRQVPDKTGRMGVIDLNGYLYLLNEAGDRSLYIDFHEQFENFIPAPGLGTGAGAIAFHPEFTTNGIFYTSHSERAGSGEADFSPAEGDIDLQWVITRWEATDPSANTFSGAKTELMRLDFPESIHGTQDITFNPYAEEGNADYGMLYICNGDGGSSENWLFENVGTNESYLTGIMRIDPEGDNSSNGKYGIPADNPFIDESGAVKELWAFGFRNPHRLSFEVRGEDTLLFVGDIGHHKIEEINLVEKGGNYAWDRREGTFLHDRDHWRRGVLELTEEDTIPYIYPVAQYDHGEGRAIALGHTWTADSDETLKGTMFFSDIPTGRLFHLPMDSLIQGRQYEINDAQVAIDGGEPTTFPEFHNKGRVDLRFSRDEEGRMMMFTKINGRIYKITGAAIGKPVAVFASDTEAGHAPLTVNLDASASTGNDLTYFWDFGDGHTSPGVAVSHTYTDPGTYQVKLIVNNGSHDSEEVSKTIQVYENPEAAIVASVDAGESPLFVILDGRTSTVDARGSVYYEWDFDDGTVSEEGYVTRTFEEDRIYTLILKVEDGLNGVDRDTLQIHVGGVLSSSETVGFQVYPNPVQDQLAIEVKDEVSISVSGLDGKQLYQSDLDKGVHLLNLSFLNKGAYLLQIAGRSGRDVRIIIKQ